MANIKTAPAGLKDFCKVCKCDSCFTKNYCPIAHFDSWFSARLQGKV
jgi:hypothetical protein